MNFIQEVLVAFLVGSLSLSAPAIQASSTDSGTLRLAEVVDQITKQTEPVTGPAATTEPLPTPTPEPVVAATVAAAPAQLIFGQAMDPSAFSLTVTYAGGSQETVIPDVVSADTSRTGFCNVHLEYRGFAVEQSIQVVPRQVTNVHMTGGTATTQTIAWDVLTEAAHYEIETADTADGAFQPLTTTTGTSYEFTDLTQGVVRYVRVRAISEDDNPLGTFGDVRVIGNGAYSETRGYAARPNDMGTVTPTKAVRKKINLKWDSVPGATAYSVYYRLSSDGEDAYELNGTATGTAYTATDLKAGYNYTFKVIPYAADESNAGAASPEAETGTAPSLPTLTVRGGDEVIRVNWGGGRAAQSYKLYISDSEDGEYELLETFLTPVDFKVYSIHNLDNDSTYYIKMLAERDVPGGLHTSCECEPSKVTTKEVNPTSTTPKLYKTKKKFMKSPACTNYKEFKKTYKYKKSFAVPGMINTNAGGFNCGYMVPQDITVAAEFMLISAYDHSKVNDSVLYVLDKTDRSLLTVMVLPHKGHVGGMAYDGANVWLAYGTKLHAIPLASIREAVDSGSDYSELYHFPTTIQVEDTVSYITYYKGRLWAGTYDELNSKNVYVYSIEKKESAPVLTKTGKMLLPNRTQGIAFYGNTMIVSRSCQTDKTKRGFLSRFEIYTPDIRVDETMSRGNCMGIFPMPPMNEGIVISGAYTYVVFESSVFSECAARIDRCIALPTKKLIRISKKTKAAKK